MANFEGPADTPSSAPGTGTLRIALHFLRRPQRAFEALGSGEALVGGLWVYGLGVSAAALFYSRLPPGFPQGGEMVPASVHGFGFWLGVGLWGLVLTAGSIFLLWGLLRAFRRPTGFSPLFHLGLWLHLFYLLLFLPLEVAVRLRSEALYRVSELGMSLWATGIAILGVRAISGLSLPKAFLAFVICSLPVAGFLFFAYARGWVSEDAMKVLLFL
ncbi:MAG: hypothetical protein HY402_01540 [Elusimicrobia bacterium]|nr:hypothetical protein [Elusimicrobiota bacterium]